MKLEPMRQVWIRKKLGKSNFEPLYTLQEIADKLEIEYRFLKKIICRKNENFLPPKPAMKTQSMSTVKTNLYKLSEFKTWLKHLGEYK